MRRALAALIIGTVLGTSLAYAPSVALAWEPGRTEFTAVSQPGCVDGVSETLVKLDFPESHHVRKARLTGEVLLGYIGSANLGRSFTSDAMFNAPTADATAAAGVLIYKLQAVSQDPVNYAYCITDFPVMFGLASSLGLGWTFPGSSSTGTFAYTGTNPYVRNGTSTGNGLSAPRMTHANQYTQIAQVIVLKGSRETTSANWNVEGWGRFNIAGAGGITGSYESTVSSASFTHTMNQSGPFIVRLYQEYDANYVTVPLSSVVATAQVAYDQIVYSGGTTDAAEVAQVTSATVDAVMDALLDEYDAESFDQRTTPDEEATEGSAFASKLTDWLKPITDQLDVASWLFWVERLEGWVEGR